VLERGTYSDNQNGWEHAAGLEAARIGKQAEIAEATDQLRHALVAENWLEVSGKS
jgi:hypothetical protein